MEKNLRGIIAELEEDISRADYVDSDYVDAVKTETLRQAVTYLHWAKIALDEIGGLQDESGN